MWGFIIISVIVLGVIGSIIEGFNRARMGTNINSMRKMMQNGVPQPQSVKVSKKERQINTEASEVIKYLLSDDVLMNTEVEYTDYDNIIAIDLDLPLDDLNKGLNEFSKHRATVRELLFNKNGELYKYAVPLVEDIMNARKIAVEKENSPANYHVKKDYGTHDIGNFVDMNKVVSFIQKSTEDRAKQLFIESRNAK